jgi:outer membrane murein-binding lipoprotein Lpp
LLLRTCLVGVLLVAATFGAPALSATADPEPSLRQLTKQVENLHIEIEKLTEDYNRERERLKKARQTADRRRRSCARTRTSSPCAGSARGCWCRAST